MAHHGRTGRHAARAERQRFCETARGMPVPRACHRYARQDGVAPAVEDEAARADLSTRAAPDIAVLGCRVHTHGISFRVLITGDRHFTDYPVLRAAVDAILSNHRPDVMFVTAGRRGA